MRPFESPLLIWASSSEGGEGGQTGASRRFQSRGFKFNVMDIFVDFFFILSFFSSYFVLFQLMGIIVNLLCALVYIGICFISFRRIISFFVLFFTNYYC